MKNIYKKNIKLILGLFLITIISCQDFLEEEVFSQYDPNTFLKDQSGVDALLTAVYADNNITSNTHRDYHTILQEFPTDIAWETGGGLNRSVVPFINFYWDASASYFSLHYNKFYSAIAKANNVLLTTEQLEGLDQETIDKINAEARFLRANSYYILHDIFGPTSIIEIPSGSTVDEIEIIGKETPRATEEEYRSYVENDLLFAVNILDDEGLSSRANRGSALALLSRFYLNNKEWSKAAETSQKVLELDYSLYNDYTSLFTVKGEGNNEYIFRFEVSVTTGNANANRYPSHAFPPNYDTHLINFGAQFRTYTSFYESFEVDDIRRQLIISEYIQKGSAETTLLNRDAEGNPLDNARSLKYWPDPDGVGANVGNDIPHIRLADVILMRAEALNELDGPNAESIELINRIRQRANASLINVIDFISKENLRDFILAERGRELYTEGLRRSDLIRHGKFVQQAIDRGISAAQPHHVLYPLPQAQLDNNPNLVQNPGY